MAGKIKLICMATETVISAGITGGLSEKLKNKVSRHGTSPNMSWQGIINEHNINQNICIVIFMTNYTLWNLLNTLEQSTSIKMLFLPLK